MNDAIIQNIAQHSILFINQFVDQEFIHLHINIRTYFS